NGLKYFRLMPTVCLKNTACCVRKLAVASGLRSWRWEALAQHWSPSSLSAVVNLQSTHYCVILAWPPDNSPQGKRNARSQQKRAFSYSGIQSYAMRPMAFLNRASEKKNSATPISAMVRKEGQT